MFLIWRAFEDEQHRLLSGFMKRTFQYSYVPAFQIAHFNKSSCLVGQLTQFKQDCELFLLSLKKLPGSAEQLLSRGRECEESSETMMAVFTHTHKKKKKKNQWPNGTIEGVP